jgi:formylglycine-generating enzyme required for sulfatase activity
LQFCNWLSRKENLVECYHCRGSAWEWDQSASGYRLPTEAEWEFACRANSATLFAHGNDEGLLEAYAVCRTTEAEPGGSRMPNTFGFFDLPGNVVEWCFDEWHSEYSQDPSVVDPMGPTNQNKPISLTGRVTRGGSYRSSPFSLGSAARNFSNPKTGADGVGFRIVRSDL